MSSDTTRWQSSVLPLFVRTIWTEGHHHVLLRHEDPILQAKSRKMKRKRITSDSSEGENGFPLSSVKLSLEELKNRNADQENLLKPFRETPICSKLIRYKLTVKPTIQKAPSPPPNNALSDRVMVWLDLATGSEKPSPKIEIRKSNNKRAATAKQKTVEIVFSPKPPIKGKTCRIPERKVEDDLGDIVTKVKRQVMETKRQLHIFLPELPKKVGSEVSSVMSSKCSSLMRTNK